MEFVAPDSESKDSDCLAHANRRAFDRFICARPHPVRVMIRPSMLSFTAYVQNFTRVGLRLYAQQAFEPGTVLAIQLRVANTGLACMLSATVMRCQETPDKCWFLGCEFSRPLSDEETLSLL
ncbi:MAG TPA: PilZ domain-containing protein [Gemmataceae bacterium]|jgi:hypothetical protein|nr:PilZ domain-containing protein [Gemmataceae bacterium]